MIKSTSIYSNTDKKFFGLALEESVSKARDRVASLCKVNKSLWSRSPGWGHGVRWTPVASWDWSGDVRLKSHDVAMGRMTSPGVALTTVLVTHLGGQSPRP